MFSDEIIQRVWEKATVVDGFPSETLRRDPCGAWILRSEYGNTDSQFGWVIDHVFPVSLGGGDDLINLRAMQWENNLSKSDDYPKYIGVKRAQGNDNVSVRKTYSVRQALQVELNAMYYPTADEL